MTTEEIAAAMNALVDGAKAIGFSNIGVYYSQRRPGLLAEHSFFLEWPCGSEVGGGATPDEALAALRAALAKVADPRAKEIADLKAHASALGYSLTACDPAASAA